MVEVVNLRVETESDGGSEPEGGEREWWRQ